MKKILLLAMAMTALFTVTCFAQPADTANHWSSTFAAQAQAEGYLDLDDSGLFNPDRYATRQEVAYMVYYSQLHKETTKLSPYLKAPVDTFTDNADIGDKYSEPISYLVGNEFMKGYPDGSIKPEGSITRAEAATIISQLIGDKALTSFYNGFNDEIPAWAKVYIERCARAGIISGYSDNTFRPNDYVTRAEILSMLYNLNKFNESVKTVVTETTTEATTLKEGSKVVKLPERTTKAETTTKAATVVTESTSETTTIDVDMNMANGLLQEINNKRSEIGANQLELNTELCKVATLKAIDMYEKNYEDHSSAKYGTIEDMLSDFDYSYASAIEITAVGVSTPVDVISLFETHPDKRDDYLIMNYDYIGIGYNNSRWCIIYTR